MNAAELLSKTFVSAVEWPEELGSTNQRALELGTQVDALPMLVGTSRQTLGRGRGSNSWWSTSGALTWSLLLEPRAFGILPPRWPALSLCVGTAVCLAIQRWQVGEVRLKWPNDVYLNERKVCGILLESVPTRPERLVMGVGLNVNNSLAQAPAELRERATSLIDETGVSYNLETVLTELLNELERVLALLAQQPADLPPLWNELSWLTGKEICITDAVGECRGRGLAIDDDGALLLETRTGIRRIISGSVTVLTSGPAGS